MFRTQHTRIYTTMHKDNKRVVVRKLAGHYTSTPKRESSMFLHLQWIEILGRPYSLNQFLILHGISSLPIITVHILVGSSLHRMHFTASKSDHFWLSYSQSCKCPLILAEANLAIHSSECTAGSMVPYYHSHTSTILCFKGSQLSIDRSMPYHYCCC